MPCHHGVLSAEIINLITYIWANSKNFGCQKESLNNSSECVSVLLQLLRKLDAVLSVLKHQAVDPCHRVGRDDSPLKEPQVATMFRPYKHGIRIVFWGRRKGRRRGVGGGGRGGEEG